MKACGLIVEYNPFHHGHLYHLREAQKSSQADCMIAVMSGSFLQRGEPAIIDKFHRAKAALASGIDIILELPYAYAVQSSDLFAKGSVHTLHQIGASSICFGSESGNAAHFAAGYKLWQEKQTMYQNILQKQLKQGEAFPEASRKAYLGIGLTDPDMDLTQPNNILGFSYVKTILEANLPIKPLTIERVNSHYHDQTITGSIASATSIRERLLHESFISPQTAATMPAETREQLWNYKQKAIAWHTWEQYFPFIHYRVMTMTLAELANIQGVDEGLENRLKKTAKAATSFVNWMEAMKTKRYTWTRLQRMFVHILTNTKKTDMRTIIEQDTVPYVRLLGLTKTGQAYLHTVKKEMNVPLITSLGRKMDPLLDVEEKASHAYYSVVPPEKREKLFKQELQFLSAE